MQIATTLALPANAFLPILDSAVVRQGELSSSSLEAIHYILPATAAAADHSVSTGCESHVDKGLLTLIHSDTAQGLQVCGPTQCCVHYLMACFAM